MANNARDITFDVGQVWSFRMPIENEICKLTVVKIDQLPGELIAVHIVTEGNSVTTCHMPFTETALRQSVIELLGIVEKLPDFEDGYQRWSESREATGQAGVWTGTVADVIAKLGLGRQRAD